MSLVTLSRVEMESVKEILVDVVSKAGIIFWLSICGRVNKLTTLIWMCEVMILTLSVFWAFCAVLGQITELAIMIEEDLGV